MRRPRLATVLGVGIPVLIVMLLLAAWAFDTSAAADGSLRNVELDGTEVGSQTEDEVTEDVAVAAAEFAGTEVTITAGDQTIETTAADLSLELDQPATVTAVLDEGREGNTALRPLAWARSFVAPFEVEPRFTVRPDQLAVVLAAEEGDEARQPVEPSLVASPETIGIQGGQTGEALDPAEVADALLDAARAGEDPITIDVDPEVREPAVTDAAAQAVADQASELTAEPVTVRVAGQAATFEVDELRSWVGSRIVGDTIELTFDEEALGTALREKIGSLGDAEPRDATFDLVGGQVQITPSVNGLRCCPDDAAPRIVRSIKAGQKDMEIEPVVEEPGLTTEEAQALGIKEPVGTTTEWNGQAQVKSFTTYHAAGGNRVANIHRMADIVRGTIVLPGETFSINDVVGQRTTEKGFLPAGAIANGEHVDEVGGGVSQFATTTFNAAFFAGLPFGEYQAHSEHFSRYPYGREATMGWEHPDLQFENDTPYGIMVWTSYTDTSITVTLYSTQYAYGEQVAQSEGRRGSCTTVTTTRRITYPDGRTATDTVGAAYRDPGATSC
ncbi:VanW family protein [Iamia majanohamensis]|uniref:VanW family protein n=1 Tax=Iamia majanohamensis TaxID=467976 RepID=A0AAE9Y441_9ACTN|nr:VanW family protein [Iamia majanohamensis]WCO65824.1 VanW family protein [Iamia majanohamensis]